MYTRREFGKLALSAVPAAEALRRADGLFAQAKPNSKFAGVQIGLNVPYNFGNNWMSGDETLSRCVDLGVSAIELRSQPVEMFLGSPATPRRKEKRAAAPMPSAAVPLHAWPATVVTAAPGKTTLRTPQLPFSTT